MSMKHYPADDVDARLFENAWCGPGLFEYGVWHLVARYAATTLDGQASHVYEMKVPERKFKIAVLPKGDRRGFVLETGIGEIWGRLLVDVAVAAALGSLHYEGTVAVAMTEFAPTSMTNEEACQILLGPRTPPDPTLKRFDAWLARYVEDDPIADLPGIRGMLYEAFVAGTGTANTWTGWKG
jgi:hypothetical protein